MMVDRDRLVTGLALIGLVLFICFMDSMFLTWVFLGILFIVSFYEAMKLLSIDDDSLYIYVGILWILALFYPTPDDLVYLLLVGYLSFMLYRQSVDLKKIYPFIYPTLSYLYILALYKEFGMDALIWLVVVVALSDSGAYFIGKKFGKTSFCAISPNKTIEGLVGGVVIASIIGSIFGSNFTSLLVAFLISAVVSISSVFGDLYESYLKRVANVKDSGSILPGHGGVLDRVDGFMFGAVIMVILLRGFI
jgi:phosphatidate cytidylyltransferase